MFQVWQSGFVLIWMWYIVEWSSSVSLAHMSQHGIVWEPIILCLSFTRMGTNLSVSVFLLLSSSFISHDVLTFNSVLLTWMDLLSFQFCFVLLFILSSTDEFYELLISTRSFSNQLLRCLWTHLNTCEVMCGVLLVMVGCCWNEHFPEMLNLHSPNHFHGTLFYYSLVKILCDIYLPILWTWPFTLLKAVLSFNTTSIKI